MYVCICKGITDTQIRDEVERGAQSLRCVRERLGVASECGRCARHARSVVRETAREVRLDSLLATAVPA